MVVDYIKTILPGFNVSESIIDQLGFPTDLFCMVATLLDTAGAFSYFNPDEDLNIESKIPTFSLSLEEKSQAVQCGQKWLASQKGEEKTEEEFGNYLSKKWDEFLLAAKDAQVRPTQNFDCVPAWWKPALELLIIADEASSDLGKPAEKGDTSHRSMLHLLTILDPKSPVGENQNNDFEVSQGSKATFSLSTQKNVSNVFPKERISMSGCSHRNFSKNLSLLPKVGNARCQWHMPDSQLLEDDDEPLDVLIIPFPYDIKAKDFIPTHIAKDRMRSDVNESEVANGWGNFSINQSWLVPEADGADKNCVDLAVSLLRSAKSDVETVNGVVFPEYALNFKTFAEVCEVMKRMEPGLEFVISGANRNCNGIPGNQVLTCVWHKVEGDDPERAIMSSRRKHHRWMLTKEQIETYALTSKLDPRISWWEQHEIGYRELHFYPFRRNSVFSSLICEDLARSDPCHEILRSVGPNLVFALLMDGPQLSNRWSARYASSLSDEPGTSVLTVTSYALLNRANKVGRYSKNDTVALFASPNGITEIQLPYDRGARGVLINLISERQNFQQTIDGRTKAGRTWHLSSSQPLFPISSSG